MPHFHCVVIRSVMNCRKGVEQSLVISAPDIASAYTRANRIPNVKRLLRQARNPVLSIEPMNGKTAVESDVPVLDKLNDFLGDKLGESQFAVWYGWEGYACLPKKYARTLYTFLQNSSLLFTDASMYIDFVSSELLDAAEIKDGLLCTRGGKYKALVLPYARVLPPGLWEKLLEWADQGIKIVFVGPEPAFTCKKVPNYNSMNNQYLPLPWLSQASVSNNNSW